ncbi:MAG: amidohydrolase family protein [Oscillospiraceae bacterium]|nr:amidohydrolase family protein [Oscillospiraceae bacterium]
MYLIKNGTVHIGDGTILEHCDILTEGNQIQAIGSELSAEGAVILDASGCEVFPGFIDPVSSIGAMGIPGRFFDNNETSDPVTPEMNLKYSMDPDEVNAQEFYKSGITTIGLSPTHNNLMGGQIAVCKTAPQKMARRLVKEGAALKCSVTSDVKQTYGSNSRLPMTKMGTFFLLQESLRKARSTPAEQRDEKQKVICSVFDDCKMPVFAAASSKNEIDGLLHLMQKEKVELTLVDGLAFADSLEQILEQKVGLILGNVNNMSQIAKHNMDLTKLQDLVANGNKVAFTNSCGGWSEGREVFLWSAIEAYRAGVAAEDVVKMLCLFPAQMLGLQDRLGTLEVGKDADLSIFCGHPVKTYAAKVVHSMINGEVLF